MTKLERYQEVEIRRRNPSPFLKICYWCGKEFYYRGIKHENIHFEPKMFCSQKCKEEWIYAEQMFEVRRLE